ncbi:hypothetical protein GF385_04770 [Candidatus Dependentiae bacterium]|nr:hypothetical protein [Candidatus Dependentiae bacterium]
MRKKVFFLFFVLIFKFILPTNYPEAGDDVPVGIYPKSLIVRGGDGIGVQSPDEFPTVQGLVWLAGGFTVVAGGGGNFVPMATPIPVENEIGLIEGGNDFPVLVSDLYLSNHVTLTVGGEMETKYGRIVLNGEFDLSDQTFILPSDGWDAKFNGNGNVLNFSNGGTIKRTGDLFFENIILKGVQTSSFIFTDRVRNLILTNCKIQLDDDFILDADFEVKGEVLVTGAGHTLCLNRYLIIREGGRLILDEGLTFSMGYPASVAPETEGIIHFNGCDIELGDNYGLDVNQSNGFYMPKGLVVFENRVRINDDSNGKTFLLGENTDLKVLGGANIILDGTTTFSIL